MRKLLKEISVIPGVTGTCIFDKTDGAVCAELDADLPKDLTENVGIHFVRLVQMGAMNKLSIKSAHFRFDKYAVVGLPLEKGAILLAICDSQANCSLVATTAAMLVEDMREALAKSSTSSAPHNGVAQEQMNNGQSFGRVDAEVELQLKEIEDALMDAIGPVAGMILTDYLNKWRQNGAAESSRFPELINMLVEEIGDVSLSTEFKKQLQHML